MKQLPAALAAFALILVPVAARAADGAGPLALGSAMPSADTPMRNVDGKDLTLAAARGAKGTLVVFTCNQCPFAVAWEDRIAALGNEFGAKGVGVIAINSNDGEAYPGDAFAPMQERAKAKGFRFPYVVDATSGIARTFGATRTPEAFLFDASGTLVYHGTIDDNAREPAKVEHHYLRDALAAVAAGRSVEVKETKAIGCGIKFRG